MSIPGADVSAIQGALDWPRFKAMGRTWAYDKCGGGVTGRDARWSANASGCRAAGIPFGPYFVFVPGDSSEAQVRAWFAASGACGAHIGELPPAIDFEEASESISIADELDALVVVIRLMTELWGRAPVLYTYPDFWHRIFANATAEQRAVIATCTLWFASYGASPPAPPPPWSVVTFWQRCGGTNGFRTPGGIPCDDDVFLGDTAALEALASFSSPIGPNPIAGVPVPGLLIPGANA